MTLNTDCFVGFLSKLIDTWQVPPSCGALPAKLRRIGLSTGISFIAETLYEVVLPGTALQGKSPPVAWRGELSRLATLNGTGDAIFICASASPRKPRARMPQVLMLKGMSVSDDLRRC